ncbi:acetyl-CoA hydrolase/transferase family protein [Sphingobium phenoxybenzoativorans]|uniref:acetyl-CoA hydrolase/transferase family protein n=1 Tax=Sphingobium phenoxybenzoativorans TaxID=1592790 RepID=UPI000873029D|nr:acetyl-CoA hydrolase/transferase C-terminal domain-containing protein [Sphingobium phenoxybenzoativorans]
MRALLDMFRPGETIYLPGATGEVVALAEALSADPERLRGVHLLSCLLPGMNRFDYSAMASDARVTTFLMQPLLRASYEAGRISIMPLSYSGIARYLRDAAPLDLAVAHVSTPDAQGFASFGIAADFSPIAWMRARRRVAIVNSRMPSIRRGPRIQMGEADLIVDCESPLVEVGSAPPSGELQKIAQLAAPLVPDGAAVQIGIGGAPGALWSALTNHRNLRLRSGMAAEGVRLLAEKGALADGRDHCAGIAAGTTALYNYLAETDLIEFADTLTTHDGARLAGLPSFTAINSALEIDLFGQVNLEWQGGRMFSGVGGAPDFVRAALASPGGQAMILMPSTARGGTISRIVPRLDGPTISLGRADADVVVTEHGVARLRGCSMAERAEALIAIADERFREELRSDWQRLSATL